jgi:hypothetical protein
LDGYDSALSEVARARPVAADDDARLMSLVQPTWLGNSSSPGQSGPLIQVTVTEADG